MKTKQNKMPNQAEGNLYYLKIFDVSNELILQDMLQCLFPRDTYPFCIN